VDVGPVVWVECKEDRTNTVSACYWILDLWTINMKSVIVFGSKVLLLV
jgi:hypothetical protein